MKDQADDEYKKGKETKEHLFRNRNQDRIEIKDKKNPLKRGSNGRFQINVVDGDESIEGWLPLNTLTPGEVLGEVLNEVLDEDGDVDLNQEPAQGVNPAEACAVELTLLE